ncbi:MULTISPECIES: hypothetical protein [unclassified Sphingomonas]|uniref:hypothetical protein n=1 Tax=unclassified Sphingomonas TaxID=196159 RepID=UPI00226A70ED|nr:MULTISPECIES: hypothetical protein [unclassified Sphingomonas]
MTIDTKSMRKLLEAAPGNKVAMEKDHVRRLLDVVEVGQSAALALAGLSLILPEQVVQA